LPVALVLAGSFLTFYLVGFVMIAVGIVLWPRGRDRVSESSYL